MCRLSLPKKVSGLIRQMHNTRGVPTQYCLRKSDLHDVLIKRIRCFKFTHKIIKACLFKHLFVLERFTFYIHNTCLNEAYVHLAL